MSTVIVYISSNEVKKDIFKRGGGFVFNNDIHCCNCIKLMHKAPFPSHDLNNNKHSMIRVGTETAKTNMKEDIVSFQLCSKKCKREFRKILAAQYAEKTGEPSCLGFICNKCKVIKPDIKQCSGCKMVRYCSLECQKSDWKNHKPCCLSHRTEESHWINI